VGSGVHPVQFHVERVARGDESSAAVHEKSTFVVPR
jgi:hypothetical protein